MLKTNATKPLISIGLMSGLNYGSEGCREGLWQLAAETFKREGVDFVMLVGGLVDSRALLEKLKQEHRGVGYKGRDAVTRDFIKRHVQHLKTTLPRIWGKKIHIETSPAYDGWIGDLIARELVRQRDDLRLYREGADRLELEHNDEAWDKVLGVYAPKKSVWMRGDFFSTPVMRVLKDEKQRGTRGMGDMNIVGCFASAITNPGDASELKLPFISLPALYKIAETRTAENQIGARILKIYSRNLKEATVVTYNFKDLVSEEWNLVLTPSDSSKLQEKLVSALKKLGPQTAGQFAQMVGEPRLKVVKALGELMERRRTKSWPGILLDENSKRYTFYLPWFQEDLVYPREAHNRTDSIVAFGCLHAGCKDTDMKFFRDEVPRIMLENNVDILCGVGDFIEGLKHDLILKGAVYGSRTHVFNYTRQEQLAAYLVSEAMTTVFRARWNPADVKKIGLEKSIVRALPKFMYIPGNHCTWVEPLGFDALANFGTELRSLMGENVLAILAGAKIYHPGVAGLVAQNIIKLEQNETCKLPSGLSMAMLHPYMSRTKTTSIRLQESLAKSDADVVLIANFHVAEAVEQWEFSREKGSGHQRVCMELGTLKHKSAFEDTKLKIVDFGVGLLKVNSRNGNITRTETTFLGTQTPNMAAANEAILDAFEKRLSL